MWRASSAAALVLALALPGRAATCGHEGTIVAMSREVLAAREQLTGFAPRQVGTEAAYLLLHYGDLPEAEAQSLLDELAMLRVRDAAELLDAWLIARRGLAVWQERQSVTDATAVPRADAAAIRALLLLDGGETYFRLFAAARAATPQDPRVQMILGRGAPFPAVVSDQSDEALLAMAAQAEAAGALVPALLMLADRADLGAFRAFLARNAAVELVAAMGTAGQLHGDGVSLRHDTGPLNPDRYPDAERRQQQRDLYTVARAAYLSGAADVLSITLNQTGEVAAVARAAAAFLAAVDAGSIDPVRDPEAGWLATWAALVLSMGPERARSALSGFDWPSRRVRHFAGKALESMDWVVAKAALRGFLAGDPPPPRPPLLSPRADWAGWLRVATVVRDGAPVGDADIPMAVDLLTLRADWAGAAALAARLPARARADMLTDLAQRLDRLCGQWTASPGQAMLLGGGILWRFDHRP